MIEQPDAAGLYRVDARRHQRRAHRERRRLGQDGRALSTISVNCFKPGHISRYQQPGGDRHTVFRVGEVHGRITERVTELAVILNQVDTAKPTQNLWASAGPN